MDSYHSIAYDLHDYLEIACLYRHRLLPELEDSVRFKAEAHTTHIRIARPDGDKEEYPEVAVEETTLLLRLDRLLAISALTGATLSGCTRLGREVCSRISGTSSSHLGSWKGPSQFRGYLVSLLSKQAGFALTQINPGVEKMSVTVVEHDNDHKSCELRALGRRCQDVHQQGLLAGVSHNKDDTHAHRIKLEKEGELQQIDESA